MTLSAEQQAHLEDALELAHNYLDHPMVQPLLERLAVTLKMIHTPEPAQKNIKMFGVNCLKTLEEELIRELTAEMQQRASLP